MVIVANAGAPLSTSARRTAASWSPPGKRLVTALERDAGLLGVWGAHGSGSRTATSPTATRSACPRGESYTLRRVWLTKEEERG